MPDFHLVSLVEAKAQTGGVREKRTLEYLGYIQSVAVGQAGKLQATEDESATAIRRRLGAAAKSSGREVTIKRVGDDIYFWTKPRGRGRPRKVEV